MHGTDPHGYRWEERSTREYECPRCGVRVSNDTAVDCPDCGRPMRNLSVPQAR
jgi:transcription initiation factor IIE alpha subunit